MSVTVIDIRSLSYTGTTWVNLLAGSHRSVFTPVIPHRIFEALRGEIQPEQLCLVHGATCEFWPAALREIDLKRNVYKQIAELSGCSHIALNNPFLDPRGLTDLESCDVRKVTVVRDGRATVASYMARHNSTLADAISWLSANAGMAEAGPKESSLRIRYEDLVDDQRSVLSELGPFVGLEYGEDASHYWQFDHHATGGNPGPFALLRRHLSGQPAHDASVENRYQRVIADPYDTVNDEKWRSIFSADELAQFEAGAGHVNRAWGYAQ